MTERVPVHRSGRLVVVPARAVDDNRLHPAGFRVLCALSTYGDRNGRCWPSLRSVANRLGICRQAVQKQIRELGRLGYIEIAPQQRDNGSTSSNSYNLLFDGELCAINDRLGDESEGSEGGQRHVAGGNPTLPGGQPLEVALIEERPIRTKDICPSKDLKAAVTDEQFDAFWVLYPRKEAKKDARKAFKAVLRDGAKLETIMAAVPLYAAKVAGKDAEFIKLAGGWLRGERFEDYAGGVAPPGRPMRQFSVAEKQAYVARHSLTGASRPIIEAKLSETGDLGRWEWAR